jgi:signal recognition particle subunit SRP19
MPTVEDYFDDETDLPLPEASGSKPRGLQGSGLRGALLEEITEDEGGMDMDYSRLAEQSRGIFGENMTGPPPPSFSDDAAGAPGKGKLAVRDDAGDLRPGGAGGPRINPNSPMGGFMGDMMKLQQAEEERMERLRKQFGNASVATDPSVYKGLVDPASWYAGTSRLMDAQVEHRLPAVL